MATQARTLTYSGYNPTDADSFRIPEFAAVYPIQLNGTVYRNDSRMYHGLTMNLRPRLLVRSYDVAASMHYTSINISAVHNPTLVETRIFLHAPGTFYLISHVYVSAAKTPKVIPILDLAKQTVLPLQTFYETNLIISKPEILLRSGLSASDVDLVYRLNSKLFSYVRFPDAINDWWGFAVRKDV